jgi:mutator protein MutT
LTHSPEVIPVVAIVAETHGRYLIGQRPHEKRHGGLWEFPGGKLDSGESMEAAARREVAEELSVELVSVGATLFTRQDPGSPYEIHFVAVDIDGEPEALEHIEVGWFKPAEMADMPMAPADAEFVEWLALHA